MITYHSPGEAFDALVVSARDLPSALELPPPQMKALEASLGIDDWYTAYDPSPTLCWEVERAEQTLILWERIDGTSLMEIIYAIHRVPALHH